MADIPEVGGAQIMGTVGINYMPAIEASMKCVTALEAVNAALKGTQDAAKQAGMTLANHLSQGVNSNKAVLDQYGRTMATAGEETGKMAQKVRVAESELAKIENRLVSVIAASQKSGIVIPGIDTQLESIRGIRDAVQSEGKISQEQLKAVNSAREFSIVQQNTLKTLEKEAESIRNMQNGEKMLADSASRRLTAEQLAREQINKQWDEYLIKQKAADEATIRKQEESAWKEYARIQEANKKAAADTTKKEIAQYDQLLKKQSESLKALPAMEAQVAAVQSKMGTATTAATMQMEKQASLVRAQIVQLRQRLKTEDDITEAEIRQVAQLEKQVNLLTKNAAIARADQKTQGKGGGQSFLEHRMGWFASGMAFYGAQDLFRRTLDTVGEVEMGMVEISRISDDATADFKEMRTELLQLGIDYGRSWTETQDIALRWAQAGYNVRDTLELTKTSMLALNTAELDAANATQSMVGIMAQWGLQADQLLPVIDKINKTADDFSVSSQDLVDGLLRSSGAARIMGMSLEETIALLTVMREASGRTGREVGNALNSILSYIQRPSAINTLEGMGIQMFTDEAKTQFRNAVEIFQDISASWGTLAPELQDGFVKSADEAGLFNEELATALGLQEEWNDLQKRDVAQATAGVYRRNYVIGLIERTANAQGVLNNMMEAEGYSLRENADTMEAYNMKLQQLKTAFTMLAVEIGEAGLLEQMKGFVDEIRGWIDAFGQLPPELKQSIIALSEAAAVMGITNLAMKTFFDASLVKGAERGVISLAAMTAGISKAEKATLGFGAALKLLAGNPITWAVVGLGALIVVLKEYQNWQEKADERTLEFINKQTKAAEAATAEADELRKLSKEYEVLASKEALTNEEKEKLNKLTEELTKKVPGLSAVFNSSSAATEKYSLAISVLRGEIELLDQQAKGSIRIAADEAASKIGSTDKKIAELRAKIDENAADYWIAGQNEFYEKLSDLPKSHPAWSEQKENSLSIADNKVRLVKSKADLIKEREELKKELDETLTYRKQLADVLDTQAKLYEDSWLKRDRAAQSKAGGTKGGTSGGATRGTATQAYEQLNADGGKSSNAYQKSTEEREREAEAREREIKQFYDDAFNDAMGYYRHVNSLARSSRDEQIKYLHELSKAHEWEKAKMWTLEEEIFRLYQDELKDQQSKFDKAYNDRIKAIEDERDAKISAIEAELAAMDKEKEDEDRTDSEKSHNEKMAELQKQRQYHELRTGAEHQKAIADLDKQIEEENQRWQKEQDGWARDDKKEALRQQIEDIKEAAEKEKEVWKQKYDEIKANWDNWVAKFAQAAIKDPRWLEIGKAIGGQLASGFSLSTEDMSRRIGNVGESVSKIDSGGYSGSSPAGYDITNPNFQYLEQTWAGGAKAYIEAQQKRYTQAKIDKNYDLMQRLEADARRVGYPLAHIGARVQSTGWAKLKHDERVLSPQLNFQFERLVAAMQTNRISSTGTAGRGDIVFNAPLFNAQKVEFEDSQDIEIFGRELQRQIQAIRG